MRVSQGLLRVGAIHVTFFSLLAVALFLSILNDRLLATGVHHSSEATRLLTAGLVTNSGDEERVSVQYEKELSAKLEEWLLEKKHPHEVINLLQLVPKHGGVKDVLNHPKFKTWLQYVKEFCNKNPGTALSPRSLLLKLYNDEEITAAINSLNPSRQQIYNELQPGWREKTQERYQSNPWSSRPTQRLIHDNFIQYWTEYTNNLNAEKSSKPKTTITNLLRAKFYDRDILTTIRIAPPVSINDRNTAELIKDEILDDWINLRKTPYEALVELRLNNPNQVPFANPLYGFWVKYVNLFNEEWTRYKMTDVEVFLRWYKSRELAKILYLALDSVYAVRHAAEHFRKSLLVHWLSHNLSLKELYRELELDGKAGETAEFHLWFLYLELRVRQVPDTHDELVQIITAFPNDKFKILQIARGSQPLQNTATNLMISYFDGALRDNIMSPSEAFEDFGLYKITGRLLNNPLFMKWLEYTKKFQREHHKNELWWFDILDKYYSDVQITYMIRNAKIKKNVLGQEVEDALIKQRLKSLTDPNDFFIKLQLNEVGENPNFLKRATFKLWNRYMNEFNEQHPDNETKMITIIERNLKDEDIFAGLRAGMKLSETKALATKLLIAKKQASS